MTNVVISSWQIVVVYTATMFCSTACIMLPFYLISKSDRLINIFDKGNSIYLRFISVVVVVWAATVLAMQGKMDEGPSAIFGMVIGYVFGAGNKPVVEEVKREKSSDN